MDEKYFELADKLLPVFYNNREKQFSEISILHFINDVDNKLLKKLLFDLETYGIIIRTESKTRVTKNIQLTKLGLKIAAQKGSYKEFLKKNDNNEPVSTFSINELHIGDKIKDSNIKDFKTSKTVNNNSESQKKQNSIRIFLVKFWWTLVIPIIAAILALFIEYYWFK